MQTIFTQISRIGFAHIQVSRFDNGYEIGGNLNKAFYKKIKLFFQAYRPAVPNLFYFEDRCRNENSLADRSRPTMQKQKFVVLIPITYPRL